jgi:beta-galactosidase
MAGLVHVVQSNDRTATPDAAPEPSDQFLSHIDGVSIPRPGSWIVTAGRPQPNVSPSTRPWHRVPGIAMGADYNPEQWPPQIWAADVRLMKAAGVGLVSVGIFSWALLEPAEGRYEFGFLDDVMDLLHDGDIAVDLATATASPPPWLSRKYPETLPVDHDGRTRWPGSRQAWCPSSPVFRERALAMAEQLATRYRDHPALAMWHVSNELGCHNVHCYCDVSAAAFRRWLAAKYGDVDALNDAWGTAFWSQRYGSFEDVLPPRLMPTFPNPTQQLDFWRFSSDALLDHYRAERDLLYRLTPGVPVTTNFMVMPDTKWMDYWAWADEQDIVSNDHYLDGSRTDPHVSLSFCADLTRGLAGGQPWMLMEHSTSAVNWQRRNYAKAPGQLIRNSLQHVARGADSVLFFQWRASRAGAEKFHSGLVPHVGTDSKVWREVVELGRILAAIGEVAGSTVRADVATLYDWQARWAAELVAHPSSDLTYHDRLDAIYRALWDAGVTTDIVHPAADLSRYRLLIVPTLYLVSDVAVRNIENFVAGGGTVLVTYFSGIVDGNDHVRLGGYPGAFRDLLGVWVEEFFPLAPGQTVQLDDGATADLWTEWLHLAGARAVASYVDGPVRGTPAVTEHRYGGGTAVYVATRLDAVATSAVVARCLQHAGIQSVVTAEPGVEVVRRQAVGNSWLFVLNHTDQPTELAATGRELIRDDDCSGTIVVPARGVAVVREGSRSG